MKCDKAQELFSDHFEGSLERPMAVALEQHLSECIVCGRDWSAFRTTWQMLETLPEVEPPPGFACDVVMKVRLQREVERRARSRWQVIWGDLFTSRVPAKVFAAAVAVLLLVQLAIRTPLRDAVQALLVPAPAVNVLSDGSQWPQGERHAAQPAEAWLHSGLSFQLDPSPYGARRFFRLLLKPDGVTKKDIRVYLMEPGSPRFDQEGISRASLIFEGQVGDSGQVIPFILGRSGHEQDVITALIAWEHRQRGFLEAVFVPTRMSAMGTAMEGSIRISSMELYSALQEVSASFGAVILVNADINALVTNVNVENGTVDDALWRICTGVGLRWRPLGAQVYIVERRIAE